MCFLCGKCKNPFKICLSNAFFLNLDLSNFVRNAKIRLKYIYQRLFFEFVLKQFCEKCKNPFKICLSNAPFLNLDLSNFVKNVNIRLNYVYQRLFSNLYLSNCVKNV